jgi:hypothetical protein
MFLNAILNFSGIDSQNVSGLLSAPMGHCIKTNAMALYMSIDALEAPGVRYGLVWEVCKSQAGYIGAGRTLRNQRAPGKAQE